MSEERLIIGAMSGTSGDGVDVALTRISGIGIDMRAALVAHHHVGFSPELKSHLFAIRGSGNCSLADLAKLGRDISLVYVQAVRAVLEKTGTQSDAIACVAAHGQTLYHAPPDTIQYFDPSLVAYEIDCPVVSDFRRADCAAGGQGAPLVPFADYVLFRDAKKNRVLLNLGGIANFTWLKAGGVPEDLQAFDVGPANCVIDHLARKHGLPNGVDEGGALAMTGEAKFQVAAWAIRVSNWVDRRVRRTLDTPEMIESYERAKSELNWTPPCLADELATACLMSALAFTYNPLPGQPDQIIASGGGVNNARLVKEIELQLKLPMLHTDVFGIAGDAKEALAFAILGAATLDGVPSNVPSVTGAKRPVILGAITPKP